jgi:hypothetical protein
MSEGKLMVCPSAQRCNLALLEGKCKHAKPHQFSDECLKVCIFVSERIGPTVCVEVEQR